MVSFAEPANYQWSAVIFMVAFNLNRATFFAHPPENFSPTECSANSKMSLVLKWVTKSVASLSFCVRAASTPIIVCRTSLITNDRCLAGRASKRAKASTTSLNVASYCHKWGGANLTSCGNTLPPLRIKFPHHFIFHAAAASPRYQITRALSSAGDSGGGPWLPFQAGACVAQHLSSRKQDLSYPESQSIKAVMRERGYRVDDPLRPRCLRIYHRKPPLFLRRFFP